VNLLNGLYSLRTETDEIFSTRNQIRLLYISFSMTHYYSVFGDQLMPTLSYARLQTAEVLNADQLRAHIKKNVMNKHDAQILESFVTFNSAILKSNFFTPTKVSLSFRLDPAFLPELEYPTRAFGLFLVVGDGFRGFHLRMKDVARGGLRMIMSRNREAYSSESISYTFDFALSGLMTSSFFLPLSQPT